MCPRVDRTLGYGFVPLCWRTGAPDYHRNICQPTLGGSELPAALLLLASCHCFPQLLKKDWRNLDTN